MFIQISRQHIPFCDVDAALKVLEQFCFLLLLPSSGERHFFLFLASSFSAGGGQFGRRRRKGMRKF
jgi:hypothetical protein